MDLTPLPTVAIAADNEQGFILINRDEFDPNQHKLFQKTEREKRPTKQTDKAE